MSQLRYLMSEICTGAEIYYTGREGGQYLKTSFVLCDDYTELTSKLFLKEKNPGWSDKKSNNHFKGYQDIQKDVRKVFRSARSQALPTVEALHQMMKQRRERRNEFFHSTHLLDLNVTPRECVEAFCDLLDYGKLLFGMSWSSELEGARNLGTLAVMLRLERKGFGDDPSVTPRVNDVLKAMERNRKGRVASKGAHVTVSGEDFYTRMCVLYGGPELKDKLSTLL